MWSHKFICVWKERPLSWYQLHLTFSTLKRKKVVYLAYISCVSIFIHVWFIFAYASSTKHLALSRSRLATSSCRIHLQIKNATRCPRFTQNSQVKTNNVSPSSQLYIAYSNLQRLPNLSCTTNIHQHLLSRQSDKLGSGARNAWWQLLP